MVDSLPKVVVFSTSQNHGGNLVLDKPPFRLEMWCVDNIVCYLLVLVNHELRLQGHARLHLVTIDVTIDEPRKFLFLLKKIDNFT